MTVYLRRILGRFVPVSVRRMQVASPSHRALGFMTELDFLSFEFMSLPGRSTASACVQPEMTAQGAGGRGTDSSGRAKAS